MEILIKNAAVVKVLEEIGATFAAEYPRDYEEFVKHVREESKNLIQPNGMSPGGHLMNFMKIPCATNKLGNRVSLYAFIKNQMQKRCGIDDFFRDRQNYFLLKKVWADAYVKKTPTPMLKVTQDVHIQ